MLHTDADRERFLAKIEKTPAGHWIWRASFGTRGYGQFYLNSYKRAIGAHRAAYELFVGPIPDGLQIDHVCRISACVNPACLEPVTNRMNTQRGEAGGMVLICKNGHPYNEDNTGWKQDKKRGWRRYCRACARDAMRRRRGREDPEPQVGGARSKPWPHARTSNC